MFDVSVYIVSVLVPIPVNSCHCLCDRGSSIICMHSICIVNIVHLTRSIGRSKCCQVDNGKFDDRKNVAYNLGVFQFFDWSQVNIFNDMDESMHRKKGKILTEQSAGRQPKVSDYVVHIPDKIFQKQSNLMFAVGRFLGKVIRHWCGVIYCARFCDFFCSVFLWYIRRERTQNASKWQIREMAINLRAKFSAKTFFWRRNCVDAFAPKSIFTVTSHTITSRNTFRNSATITIYTWCWSCVRFDRSRNCSSHAAPLRKSNAVSSSTKYWAASAICTRWKLSIVTWSCRTFFCRTTWVWKSVISVWRHESPRRTVCCIRHVERRTILRPKYCEASATHTR